MSEIIEIVPHELWRAWGLYVMTITGGVGLISVIAMADFDFDSRKAIPLFLAASFVAVTTGTLTWLYWYSQ